MLITSFFLSLFLGWSNPSINSNQFVQHAEKHSAALNISVFDFFQLDTITPNSICDTLFTGESSTTPITITNPVNSDFNFNINVEGEGGDYNESSSQIYSVTGATTTHIFTNISPNVQELKLQITLNGDFDSPLESADVFVEGFYYGAILDNDVPNGTDIFYEVILTNSLLSIWLDDGTLEVVVANSSNVGVATGQFDTHIVNLISIGTTWISADQNSGTIPVDESFTFLLTLDADKLFSGIYTYDMIISDSDANHPPYTIPVKLVVIGQPVLELSDTMLNFGEVFVGEFNELNFSISNQGTENLFISSFASNNPQFSFIFTTETILPFQSKEYTLQFAPESENIITGDLSISSNVGEFHIALQGEGLLPPHIEVTPDSFCINLNAGEMVTENLVISNIGNNLLEYQQSNFGGCGGHLIETFEDGQFQDFSLNNPGIYSYTFTPNDPAEGNLSLKMDGGNFIHSNGLQGEIKNCQSESISFYVKSNSTTTADGYFIVQEPSFHDVIFFFMRNDGFMGVFNSSSDNYMMPYLENVWYNIEFKDIDYSNQQYDFYVDGNLIAANVSFRFFAEEFTTLQLYNLHPSISWYDDIQFSNVNLQADWAIVDSNPGVILEGMSDTSSITFDATNLIEGIYQSELLISTNDPDNPEYSIPLKLNVDGFQQIEVKDSIINFGNVFQGFEEKDTFWIINPGTANLHIDEIISPSVNISVNFTSAIIEPFDSIRIPFSYVPNGLGDFSDSLEIINNASIQFVHINSTIFIAPIASITPDTICLSLLGNETADTSFAIQNTGGSILNFQLANQTNFIDRKVLLWEYGADIASELPSTYAAIAAFSPNLNLTSTNTTDLLEFEIALTGKHVLIIPESETGSPAIFAQMKDLIQAFIQDGGTVIYCGVSDSQPYLHTGSFAVTAESVMLDSFALNINIPSHPILTGTSGTLSTQNATGWLLSSSANVVPVVSLLNNPVVMFREIGNGKAIFLGYDFFTWDDNTARILSNAIHWSTLTLPDWLSVSPTFGNTEIDTSSFINLNIDATGLATETYISNLTFTTNDPINTTVETTIKLIIAAAPQTALAANPTFNCDGAIQFFDLSENGPTSWEWDFGNGEYSTEQNPFYIYPESGIYDVQLIACNIAGCDTISQEELITIDYDYIYCDTLSMIQNSTEIIELCAGVLYDEGGPDGNYSNSSYSVITIQPPGASSISLTFLEFDLEDQFDFLGIYDGPVNTDLIDIYTGTDLPLGGLPINSTDGIITIVLDSDNSFTRPGFRMFWECQHDNTFANFEFDTSFHCGNEVQFINTSFNADIYLWDFGDGLFSNEENPTHIFGLPGNYTVTLSVNGSTGISESTQQVLISNPDLSVNMAYQSPVLIDEMVQFEGISDDAISWHWDFGIATDTIQSPSLSFPEMGEYIITLTIMNEDSCTAWISDNLIVQDTTDAVSEIDDLTAFKLFPNPTNDILFLELEFSGKKIFDIQIMNALGQIVAEDRMKGQASLQKSWNLANLPAGVYFLKMVDEKQRVLGRKILVE